MEQFATPAGKIYLKSLESELIQPVKKKFDKIIDYQVLNWVPLDIIEKALTQSPGIQCHSDEVDPLRSYLESLVKVEELDIKITFPGHRGIIRSTCKRIKDLFAHHEQKMMRSFAYWTKSAFQVASRMTWNLPFPSWNEVPEGQKWFATDETIAHLRYPEGQRKTMRKLQSGILLFSLA